MLTLLLILTYLCFLGILFYYQKQEKMYIGYTTVLSMFFCGLLLLPVAALISGYASSDRVVLLCLVITVWVLGSVLIYLTSQLTLAFRKISDLSQYIALKETKNNQTENKYSLKDSNPRPTD